MVLQFIRLLFNLIVSGVNVKAPRHARIAQQGRASALQAEGPVFDPQCGHHLNKSFEKEKQRCSFENRLNLGAFNMRL